MLADWFYLQGITGNTLTGFKKAKAIFPYEKNFLTGEIEFYVRNKIISREAYMAAKEAVAVDPYSGRFLSLLMQLANYQGDFDTVRTTFELLKQKFPSVPIVREMVKLQTSRGN